MSRARRLRRQQGQTAATEAKTAAPAVELPVPRAPLWLAGAFLLPNLGALACGFVFDDRVLIVDNQTRPYLEIRLLA